MANRSGTLTGVWIDAPETFSWVAFGDATAFANWDEFSSGKLTRPWPEWGFPFGLNGFERHAAALLDAMRARGAGRPWPTPADGLTIAYPVRAHVRRLMRKIGLVPATLVEQLARDIATESELLTKIDQAQAEVISFVRDGKLSAYGRRAARDGEADPTAVHEKLDRKLFLGPRTIDLDGWVREDTNLPFRETQGYGGPYFDRVRFRVDEVARLWRPIPVGESSAIGTIAAERRTQAWLAHQMAASPETPESKAAMRKKAAALGLTCTDRAYSRAWLAAVRETGAVRWSEPGRKSSRRIDTAI